MLHTSTSFSDGALVWLTIRDTNLAYEQDFVGEIQEAEILQHAPCSAVEAAIILEVVSEALTIGGRCDAMDLQALRNIQAFLVGDGSSVAPPLDRAAALIRAVESNPAR